MKYGGWSCKQNGRAKTRKKNEIKETVDQSIIHPK